MSAAPINSFPFETLCRMCTYLPGKDRFSAASTCKKGHEAAITATYNEANDLFKTLPGFISQLAERHPAQCRAIERLIEAGLAPLASSNLGTLSDIFIPLRANLGAMRLEDLAYLRTAMIKNSTFTEMVDGVGEALGPLRARAGGLIADIRNDNLDERVEVAIELARLGDFLCAMECVPEEECMELLDAIVETAVADNVADSAIAARTILALRNPDDSAPDKHLVALLVDSYAAENNFDQAMDLVDRYFGTITAESEAEITAAFPYKIEALTSVIAAQTRTDVALARARLDSLPDFERQQVIAVLTGSGSGSGSDSEEL